MNLDDFTNKPMTLAEVEALRRGKAISKGPSRLEVAIVKDQIADLDEKAFRKAVIDRDGKVCRCCKRKVVQTIARVPERLEVNHIHGRRGRLRYEKKTALVLCLRCHERVTGRVNDRLAIVPTKTFMLQGRKCTDARAPVTFKKVA